MNKGIILAGGNGTRLRPLTYVTNKHLLPVYNKPMIEYPLKTLIDMGCDDILIVTGKERVGHFAEYLGDGSKFNVKFTYKVQEKAGGIAEALACAEGFVDAFEYFPVILGDNYFQKAPIKFNAPTLFVKAVDNPNRFGVLSADFKNIQEKPKKPETNLAVLGLYIFDIKVFDFIKKLEPSERGELEITDVNNMYLESGAEVRDYKYMWSDMGTLDSLMEVANRVKQL